MKKKLVKILTLVTVVWSLTGTAYMAAASEEEAVFSDDSFVAVTAEELPAEEIAENGVSAVSVSADMFTDTAEDISTFTDEFAPGVVIEKTGIETMTSEEGGFSVPATEWGYQVLAGEEVELAVFASAEEGYQLTYAWYQVAGDETKTLVEGVLGDTCTVTASEDTRYCCLVSDGKGYQQYVYFNIYVENDNAAKEWTVFNGVILQSAIVGDDVVLKPAIEGRDKVQLTYQWYKIVQGGQQAIDGAVSNKYTAKNVQSDEQYVCVITDEKGNQESVTFELEIKNINLGKPVISSIAAAAGKKVTLSWGAVDGAEGYRVYRKNGSESWTRLTTLDSEVLTYTDSTPKAGVVYSYSVRALVNANGKNYFSKYATAKKATAKTAAPTVTVKEVSYNTAQISWGAVEGAVGYRIYRKGNGVTKWTTLKTVSSSTKSYKDTTVKPGVEYAYTVRAYCMSEGSKLWGSYSSKGKTITTKTNKPTLVSAKSQGYNKIKVTWKAAGGAEGYRVYRKTADSGWKLLKNVSASTKSYTDSTAQTGVTYYYTVRSFCKINGSKVLGYYDKTGKSAVAKPASPTLVSAKISSTKKTKITWKAVSGATGYRVYRKSSGGEWERLTTTTTASTLTYTDTTAKGKSYIYTVRAYRLVDGAKVWGTYSTTGITSKK